MGLLPSPSPVTQLGDPQFKAVSNEGKEKQKKRKKKKREETKKHTES
jgi:hypothetical protein